MFTNACIILIAVCHPTAGQSGSFAAGVKTMVSERSHARLLAMWLLCLTVWKQQELLWNACLYDL